MAFDINNTYSGNLFGKDRQGHTTPDAEATETLRPWLPVPYPAPYLPSLRGDQGHPVIASVVLSSNMLVGQDASGALVPAGLQCGQTGTVANGGVYHAFKYTLADVGFAYNAQTGALVAAAGEVAVIGRPNDGTNGDVITFPDATTYTVTAGDITAAAACTLFQGRLQTTGATGFTVKPAGVVLRNVFQYIGGVTVTSTTGGMKYTLNGVIPTRYAVHNYMHEMGTAIQTSMVVRVPWIGALPNSLTTLTSGDGMTGYTQGNYSRSFVHFTGASGNGDAKLAYGNLVAASRLGNGTDAGHYMPFDTTKHDASDIVGRIIGIQNVYPIRDYLNRVRTLWNPGRLVGPVKDPNPSSIQMGGSATAGIDYQLNLGTDGALSRAVAQNKTVRPEYSTYVLVKIML
jgi:hypothetical protein